MSRAKIVKYFESTFCKHQTHNFKKCFNLLGHLIRNISPFLPYGQYIYKYKNSEGSISSKLVMQYHMGAKGQTVKARATHARHQHGLFSSISWTARVNLLGCRSKAIDFLHRKNV